MVDSSGEKVGKINDLTFTFDGNLKLSQFILAGSKWEEFLEAAKFRPDKDPVLDASIIKVIGDRVQLNTNVNALKTTLDEGAIKADEIRWSDLTKLDIVDKDDVKVGRAVDVDFDTDGMARLIVGGSFIEESLESVGLKADVDILVPSSVITGIAGRVQLNVSKEDLEHTMANALESPEIRAAQEKPIDQRATVRVRLY